MSVSYCLVLRGRSALGSFSRRESPAVSEAPLLPGRDGVATERLPGSLDPISVHNAPRSKSPRTYIVG